jgi:hypothetical protein
MGKILDAIDEVAKEYGIHRDLIFGAKNKVGTCRDFRASAARWKIIYLFCIKENMPYCHVAYYLRLNPTTVRNAGKRMEKEGHDYMDQRLKNINKQTKYRHSVRNYDQKAKNKIVSHSSP